MQAQIAINSCAHLAHTPPLCCSEEAQRIRVREQRRRLGRDLTPAEVEQLHPAYKTRVCIQWRDGHCRHGAACTYAHGESELRSYGLSLEDVRPYQSCMLTACWMHALKVSHWRLHHRSLTALRRSHVLSAHRATAKDVSLTSQVGWLR